MSASDLPQPSPSVAFKEVDDGAVLYCAESETYFRLNAVGVRIWKFLVMETGDREKLVDAVCESFPDASAAEVRADVDGFLAELQSSDLAGHSSQGTAAG